MPEKTWMVVDVSAPGLGIGGSYLRELCRPNFIYDNYDQAADALLALQKKHGYAAEYVLFEAMSFAEQLDDTGIYFVESI
jgi:hypothetical protein